MGFNTVAVLYNDFTSEFECDGRLGRDIAHAMRSYPAASSFDRSFGAGMVISQDHADGEQVTIVSRNSGVRADDATDLGWQALEQMKRCLERHGYRVTKLKPPRVATFDLPQGE